MMRPGFLIMSRRNPATPGLLAALESQSEGENRTPDVEPFIPPPGSARVKEKQDALHEKSCSDLFIGKEEASVRNGRPAVGRTSIEKLLWLL
jgi:hypothetical protein